MKNSTTYITKNAKETEDLASEILNNLFALKKHVICLHGDLGAGKTTLVKGIAKCLKIKKLIKSPTYTYVNSYPLKTNNYELKTLHHFDLYRLSENTRHFHELEELLENPNNLIIIEWAERLPQIKSIGLHISLKTENKHHIISIA